MLDFRKVPHVKLPRALCMGTISIRTLVATAFVFIFAAWSVAQTTVTPSASNGWAATTTTGGQVTFAHDAQPPSGNGALRLTTINDNNSRARFQYNLASPVPISNINDLGYRTKVLSAPLLEYSASYSLGVFLDGTPGSFASFNHEPYWQNSGSPDPAPVVHNIWQTWDVDAGLFWASRPGGFNSGSCVIVNGAGGPPFYSLANLKANCPNAVVVYYAVYIGSFNPNLDVLVDLADLNGDVFNFEPEPVNAIYNSMFSPLAPNYISLGFQATSTDQLGDYVTLAGTNRLLQTVSVTMSNWALQSTPANVAWCTANPTKCNSAGFKHPITVNLYDNSSFPGVGSPIVTLTQEQFIPWRPEADITCTSPTAWRSPIDNLCYNGYAFDLLFDLSSLNAVLPNSVIVGIAYNTQTHGDAPLGVDGPYNSLNVSVDGSTSIGTDVSTGHLFWDTVPAFGGDDTFKEMPGFVSGTYSTIPFKITALPVTHYVDDDGQIGPNGECDLTGTTPFTTISGAVAAAAAGDIIRVCPGTYNGAVTIPSGKDSLTILGPNEGVHGTAVRGPEAIIEGAGISPGLFSFNSNGNIVDGFKIESTAASIVTNSRYAFRVVGNNNVIRNNYFENLSFVGSGSSDIYALLIAGTSPSIAADGTQVLNNYIKDYYNNITRGHGMNIGGSNLATNTLVEGNTVEGGNNGIYIDRADATTIRNNQIIGNRRSGIVDFQNMIRSSLIERNVFENNGFGDPTGATLNLFGSNTTVRENVIRNNPTRAVWLRLNGAFTGVSTINFNRILGNNSGIINDISSSTTNAENNWWGCNYGPNGATGPGCTAVSDSNGGSGTVDATPWLTLTSDAVPGGVLVNGNSAITSRLTINSLNADTSGSGFVRNGTPATFAATLGTVAPPSNTTTSGVTNTTFTAGPTQGAGSVSTTVDGQTVTSTIGIYNSACAEVSTPTLSTKTAIPITIPVITDELTNRGVISIDFRLSYDPTVLSAGSLTAALGSVTAGATLNTFAPSPGELQVSIYTTTPFSGSGSIVDLTTNVIGPIGSTSPLTLSNLWYNGTLVCSTTVSGSVTVISGEVSGQVTYAHQPGVKPVPGANLSAPGVPPVSGVTNASGNYLLSGFGPGSYTVTPSKANKLQACDVGFSGPNGIFSNDASAISQHIVGITPITDPVQLNAAWVSEGTTPFLSSFDAALISQWIVCINNPINLTGRWFFTPVNRSYADVIPDFTNQDYTALLKGDVNGDWSDTGPLRPAPMTKEELENAVRVSIGDFKADKGTLSLVPLRIDNLNGMGVTSYQFDVEFDPNVLTPDEVGAEIERTISESLLVVSNSPSEGLLKVVVYGAWPVNGDGVYVNLRFRATGDVGASSPLSIRQFRFNDGNVRTRSIDGTMTILDPRGPRLTGTLVTSVGRPIGNALVVLTNSRGETMSVRSSRNGNYEFAGLDIGETYTISAKANGYTFSPISISMTRSTMSADLISDQ